MRGALLRGSGFEAGGADSDFVNSAGDDDSSATRGVLTPNSHMLVVQNRLLHLNWETMSRPPSISKFPTEVDRYQYRGMNCGRMCDEVPSPAKNTFW